MSETGQVRKWQTLRYTALLKREVPACVHLVEMGTQYSLIFQTSKGAGSPAFYMKSPV